MISFNLVNLNVVKESFFNKDAVTKAVNKGTRDGLSRAGAFIRQRAKSSIRQRKRSSAPGDPPSSHTGVLRRFIFFAYEPATNNVVIGPLKTNQVFFDKDRRPVTGTVPEILEYGGEITLLESRSKGGEWRRADLRSRRQLTEKETRYRTVKIAPRPYMHPARDQEMHRFSDLLKNSVTA